MISPSAFVRTLIVAALAAVLAFAPAHAQQVVTITTTVTWVYDDEGEGDVLLGDEALAEDAEFAEARRYAPSATLETLGTAQEWFEGKSTRLDYRTHCVHRMTSCAWININI